MTIITGMDLWQLPIDEVVPLLSVKCAGTATVHEANQGGGKRMEV